MFFLHIQNFLKLKSLSLSQKNDQNRQFRSQGLHHFQYGGGLKAENSIRWVRALSNVKKQHQQLKNSLFCFTKFSAILLLFIEIGIDLKKNNDEQNEGNKW